MCVFPDLLLEDVVLWDAEEERLLARLRKMEEEMLEIEMEVEDESESFN